MLLARIVTSFIVLPLLLAAIIWMPSTDFAVMVGAVIVVGAWEWAQLAGFQKPVFRALYVLFVLLGMLLSAFIPQLWMLGVAIGVLVWMLIAVIHYQCDGVGAGFQMKLVRAITGLIILVATWTSIIALKSHSLFGVGWLILVLLMVVGADVGGYFVGRLYGKTPFCSRVSPHKTWEGFFGGLFLSIFVAVIGGLFLAIPFRQYLLLLLLALVTAIFAAIGDLSESLLKRIAGIKDSGGIFPGHGGMLDRLDSISAASIIFVFGMLVMYR